MGFEINDGKERIPDEEDIYGVNDIEEQDRFNALLGGLTQETRVRRRRTLIRWTAVLVVVAFILAFGILGLRQLFGW